MKRPRIDKSKEIIFSTDKKVTPKPIDCDTDGLGRKYNSEGLRYVSPEVGYVDKDEEYY